MPAYVIFTRERTRKPAEMEAYGAKVQATLAGHSPTMLALYGEFETLEGAPIEGAVVMQFSTVAEAKAWYDSPAYQEAAAHRHAGADYRAFIIEGVA